MSSIFRPTTAADGPGLAKLLASAFDSPPQSSLLAPAVMAWKYWETRGDWSEPRSYVLDREGVLSAHVGLWPVQFNGIRGVQMIDWAAAQESPGAGISLMQRLTRMFDFVYSIGGSEMTRKLLPASGFQEVAQTWTAARPLRPLRQALIHQSRNWKLPVRAARNWWWSKVPPAAPAAAWSVEEIEPSQVSAAGPEFFPRASAFFEYFLRCPAAPSRLYGLRSAGRPEGHVLLSLVRGQARLSGVWLREAAEANWRAAFLLAQCAARGIPGACEIAAKGSQGVSGSAATQAGLRMVATAPVFLLSKQKRFAPPSGFQFQLIDDDGAFLDIGRTDHLT
jgi:hypothetical protein